MTFSFFFANNRHMWCVFSLFWKLNYLTDLKNFLVCFRSSSLVATMSCKYLCTLCCFYVSFKSLSCFSDQIDFWVYCEVWVKINCWPSLSLENMFPDPPPPQCYLSGKSSDFICVSPKHSYIDLVYFLVYSWAITTLS